MKYRVDYSINLLSIYMSKKLNASIWNYIKTSDQYRAVDGIYPHICYNVPFARNENFWKRFDACASVCVCVFKLIEGENKTVYHSEIDERRSGRRRLGGERCGVSKGIWCLASQNELIKMRRVEGKNSSDKYFRSESTTTENGIDID